MSAGFQYLCELLKNDNADIELVRTISIFCRDYISTKDSHLAFVQKDEQLIQSLFGILCTVDEVDESLWLVIRAAIDRTSKEVRRALEKHITAYKTHVIFIMTAIAETTTHLDKTSEHSCRNLIQIISTDNAKKGNIITSTFIRNGLLQFAGTVT